MCVCIYVCMCVCTYVHIHLCTRRGPESLSVERTSHLGAFFGLLELFRCLLGAYVCMYVCTGSPFPTEDDDVMELPVKLPVRASSQRPRDAQRASERHRDAQRGQLRRRNTFLSSCEKDLCNRQYVLSKDMTIMSWTICACRSLWPRDKP